MSHEVFLLHAERIQRTDHALLLLDLMHDKNRNHIRKQCKHNDARGQSGVSVHDDIACGGGNADIILRFYK